MTAPEPLDDDALRQYATTLILEHARNIEFLSIFEMAEEHAGTEITEAAANKVLDLIQTATLTVEHPDGVA